MEGGALSLWEGVRGARVRKKAVRMTVLISHCKQGRWGTLNPSRSCQFQPLLPPCCTAMSLNPQLGQQGSWIILEESILEITRYKSSCAYAGVGGVGAWDVGRMQYGLAVGVALP